MKKQYTVIRPLEWPYDEPTSLPSGVSVGKLPQEINDQFSGLSLMLSGQQIDFLKKKIWWLQYDFEDEITTNTDKKKAAEDLVRDTALAIQIVTPIGDYEDTTMMLCEKWDSTWSVTPWHPEPKFSSTSWARDIGYDSSARDDLSAVVAGVHKSVQENIVRLVNPLRFLEHGLRADELHIRLFLWVAGLDALLMSGRSKKLFVQRLCNFLGGDSYVFPNLKFLVQPCYKVKDVAKDLYDLRSNIAHGSEIHVKFREKTGFKDCQGKLIGEYSSKHQYRQVLGESALFLLTRALRKVFVSDLVDTVGDREKWRSVLKQPNSA